MIIDGKDHILGRLASFVAKALLEGQDIVVVNSKDIVVTGSTTFDEILEKVQRGDPHHGPFYPKRPDRIFKRVVRGMLPYRKEKGRKAFKRLRVYIGVPDELAKMEKVIIKDAHLTRSRAINLVRLEEVSNYIT